MASIISPCKDCRYRHIGCHSDCFLYKEWKSQTNIINEIKSKEKDTYEAIRYHKRVRKR